MGLFQRLSGIHLPISVRLSLWYGLTLLILLSLFAVFCYTNFHVSLHNDFDRHLTHETRELLPFIRAEGGRPGFASLDELRSVAYMTDGIYGTYVRLLSSEGEVLYRSPNFEGHRPLPVRLPETLEEEAVSFEWEANPARTMFTPLVGSGERLQGWLEVTGFEWSLHQELYRLGRALVFGIVLSMVLAMGGGFLLARRALRPVAALTQAANQIRATDLSARLPTHFGMRDELTDLGETFNAMLERIEASFNRERRFTSNAAHELLTPLTTVRSGVEVSLRREREAEKYRQALQAVLLDVEEMTETVQGLLQLSRVERLKELPRERIDLGRLTEQHTARFAEQALREGIRLHCDIERGLYVAADAAHLGEVIDNLIDNALKYTPEGGAVRVRGEAAGSAARLTVTDTGVGFTPEEAAHLFDRFYRADVPEVQKRSGSGLGLAIVQAIAEAYDGSVAASSPGLHQGSTFEVRLPLVSQQTEQRAGIPV